MSLENLAVTSFQPLIGDVFEIDPPIEDIDALTLDNVAGLTSPGTRSPGFRDPFRLLFRGPATAILPQGIHALRHKTLGRLEIFLVPLQPDAEGPMYEAIFG
jgi:hypothetical protein